MHVMTISRSPYITYKGVGSNDSSHSPVLLKTIRDQGVKYIQMGEEHSVALTYDGGVFTWGHGAHGQLGHNTIARLVITKYLLGIKRYTKTLFHLLASLV